MSKGQWTSLAVIMAVSLATHFAWFGHPNTTVFDEVHFGKFISAYFTHEYYFDIHPPLGKLILAGWGKLWGFRPGFSFANIGDVFPDRAYMALRFLPALAGTLLPVVIFLLASELGFSSWGATGAGMLVAVENGLITQSRYILLDSFLLLFGFYALYSYIRYRRTGRLRYLTIMGCAGGAALAVKWTGLTFLALPALDQLFDAARARALPARPGRLLAAFILIPAIVYVSAFAIHFALLTKSGPGDAFMSPEFQKTLRGNSYEGKTELVAPSFAEKFLELNAEMYRSNQRLTATHPYGSPWYTWPFMTRPVFYWTRDFARIYLLGNPVIWWGSTLAVGILIGLLFVGRRHILRDHTLRLLLVGYAINFFPFAGITRVMFLYHYLAALVFAILMLAYMIGRQPKSRKNMMILMVAACAAFLFFAPLTYGLPLAPKSYENRVWLNSWL